MGPLTFHGEFRGSLSCDYGARFPGDPQAFFCAASFCLWLDDCIQTPPLATGVIALLMFPPFHIRLVAFFVYFFCLAFQQGHILYAL